jgi:hypothetical protein
MGGKGNHVVKRDDGTMVNERRLGCYGKERRGRSGGYRAGWRYPWAIRIENMAQFSNLNMHATGSSVAPVPIYQIHGVTTKTRGALAKKSDGAK